MPSLRKIIGADYFDRASSTDRANTLQTKDRQAHYLLNSNLLQPYSSIKQILQPDAPRPAQAKLPSISQSHLPKNSISSYEDHFRSQQTLGFDDAAEQHIQIQNIKIGSSKKTIASEVAMPNIRQKQLLR